MNDPPRYPADSNETERGPKRTSASRWLSILGIALLLLLVAFIVIAHLTGLIGPGRH
jgi:hypothetical protein